MHNIAFAEWLLARFTQPPRAAAILGDLQETSAQKGRAWFWRSYLRILFANAWQPLLAFLFLLFGGDALGKAVISIYLHSVKMHTATTAQQVWLGGILTVITSMLSCLAIYTTVRFGPRDIVTRLILAYSLLGIGVLAFWWQPAILSSLAVAALALFAVTMRSTSGRRGMASFSILTTAQPVIFLGVFLSLALSQYLGLPFIHQASWDHILKPILTLLICIIVGRVHRRFQQRRLPSPA